MTKAPKLELPPGEPAPRPRSGLSGFVFVLLLILLVVNVMSFFVSPGTSNMGTLLTTPGAVLSVEQIKEVAVELENKNISTQAADYYEEYLSVAQLSAQEVGNIRYRIGKNRQDAGDYAAAFAQYVVAEKLLEGKNSELVEEIGRRRRECLRQMGRYAELAREIAERARGADQTADLEGQQVVAEIGSEKITVADFERMMASEIELFVKWQVGLSPEDEDAVRRRAEAQFADPQMRMQQLQQIIATRVLADEARVRRIHETEGFRDRLAAVGDGILKSTLLHQEVGKRSTVTHADIQRFYEANKDRYEQPAATFIAHILCRGTSHARDVIRRISQGERFEDIAQAESLDTSTRGAMGTLTVPVSAEGEFVPLFGANPQLHAAIRGAEAGAILPHPYQSVQGWHVVKVVSHRERIEQPLDEIIDQVRRDTRATREREVTEQYMAELFEKHGVKLYPGVFGGEASPADAGGMP